MRFFTHTKKGMALVELIVGVTIISIALVALLSNYKAHLKAALANTQAVKASYLAEEGFEVVRFLRDSSWTSNIASLSKGTRYYLSFTSNAWTLTTTPRYVEHFDRYVVFSAVNRDSASDITTSGGTPDANTIKVDVTVAWNAGNATTTKLVSTYLTNFANN